MAHKNPATARRTRILQLVLVVASFFALWAGLHLFDPFVDSPRVKKWLEEWLQFLSPGARDFIVRQGWQAFVAGIVAAKAFAWFEPLASYVVENWLHEFPPFLKHPGGRRDSLDSPLQQLAFVGRTKELQELHGFLEDTKRLSWWWVNGREGSGKSRLALEWVHSLRRPLLSFSTSGYDAGLFVDNVGKGEWPKQGWKPRRPTVIVVDDAAEHIPAIVEMLEYLIRQPSEFGHPVRVLLVERSVPQELTNLHKSSELYEKCHKPVALDVAPLGAEHIRELGRELSKRLGKRIDLPEETVQRVLNQSAGLPLFVILALGELAEHGEFRVEARDELLRKELLRTRGKMQQHGIGEAHFPLLALATFVRGLSWEAAATYLQTLPSPKKLVLDRLFHEDTARAIPPIQPDLVGEYFLLEEFGDLTEPERKRFLQTAWRISGSNVRSMLVKVAMDFPAHPSLAELDRQPENPEDATWWGRVRVDLLGTARLSPDAMAHSLQQLKALSGTDEDSTEFQKIFAQGMANADFAYRRHGLWDESLKSLLELDDFAKARRDNTQIQLILAQAAADVLESQGSGQHRQEIQTALQIQTDLSKIESVEQSAEFQLTMAVTCARFLKAGNWKGYKGLFPCLNDIARRFPQCREIQRVVAQAAMEALWQWYNDELDTDEFFGGRGKIDPDDLRGVALSAVTTLSRLADRDFSDRGEDFLEIAAIVAKTVAFPIFDWERMDLSLKVLETLAKRRPEDVDLQTRFVNSAINVLQTCVHFSQQAEKAAEMQAIVQRLTDVVPAQFQQREEIANSFATAKSLLAKPLA